MTSLSLIQRDTLRCLGETDLLPDGSSRTRAVFDASYAGFDGHFPERPLLPAVCLLGAAELLAQRTLGDPLLRTAEIVRLKVRNPVTPGDETLWTLECPGNRTAEPGQPVTVTAAVTVHGTPAAALTLKLIRHTPENP